MAYGRGGAGNYWQAQEEVRRAAEQQKDLEAQPTATSTTTTASAPPALDETQTPQARTETTSHTQQYAHTGRGGAGNWYSPAELSRNGVFTSSSTATESTSTPSSSSDHTPAQPGAGTATAAAAGGIELPIARTGRGGAGNFVWGSTMGKEDAAAAAKKEEEEGKRVRAKAEEDVEQGLAKPPGALLKGEVVK